ncbi:MAG: YIP1 family protein [Bacteroidales bacterium]|nr:YIP1 family protein [Bacteroidales bacterium]
MSSESFNFNQFVKDSVNSLTKPKAYFAEMPTTGGLGVPIVKALIYGAIAGIFTFLWSLLKVGGATTGLLGGAVGIMALIWMIIGALIGLFIGAVIMLILSAICGGSTDFEANARVTASLMVLMPINALFGFIGGGVGSIIAFIINLYGLYMIYHALTQTLKGKEGTSRIIAIILAVILIIFLITGFFAKKTAKRYLDNFESEWEQTMEESGKDLEKSMKDLSKELEEAVNDIEEDSGK